MLLINRSLYHTYVIEENTKKKHHVDVYYIPYLNTNALRGKRMTP